MHTYQSIFDVYDVAIPAHLEAQAEVPVLAGVQRQGDVLVIPRGELDEADYEASGLVPVGGLAVVRGENGGNTHWLHAEGPVRWAAAVARAGDVALGVLDVSEGAVAYLIHTGEHGANAVAPGCYRLHGKREQVDEIRRVAD